VSEQNITIEDLKTEKNDLTSKISELEKENKELKEKNQKKTTTSKTQSISVSTSASGTSLGKFKITAYCNCSKCCGKWANGYTASGTVATAGRTVAMSGVPFGTKLLINGHVYTVEDRGTPYGHVDIFFNTHSEALQFGRKYADVYRVN
jgi:3D (Asp-Asp-Asp) domain-containing protein